MDMFSYVLGETAAESRMEEMIDDAKVSTKAEMLAEMKRIGIILPKYDWQDKGFNDTLEAITLDWLKRHPEVKRGSGYFQKNHPEKIKALDMLSKMSGLGRITPDEYVILYREIYNF